MVKDTVGSGIVVVRVRRHLVPKRNPVYMLVHFGKHMSCGEQRSPIFQWMTDVHHDNFNVCYGKRQNEKRSSYMRQEKNPLYSS